MLTATAKRTGRINHSGLIKPENAQTKPWLFEVTSQLFMSNKSQQISRQFLPMHLVDQSIQARIGNALVEIVSQHTFGLQLFQNRLQHNIVYTAFGVLVA